MPGGSLAVPRGQEVVPVANRLICLKGKWFDKIIATQDWHPKQHRSFASQHGGYKPGDVIQVAGLEQVLWPDHCVQGSSGAKFFSKLNIESADFVVQKGTDMEVDSYSGFFDNGRRKVTLLLEYLRNNRISDLYLLGLATDYCVKFTALDAVSLGFRTFLVEDGCRGVNLKSYDSEVSVKDMKNAGVHIMCSQEL